MQPHYTVTTDWPDRIEIPCASLLDVETAHGDPETITLKNEAASPPEATYRVIGRRGQLGRQAGSLVCRRVPDS